MAPVVYQSPGNSAQFKTDAVLTQIVSNMAKLHRAVLRNWHHILIMVGNFAGPAIDIGGGEV
jgi:hypothetical protein